MKKGTKAQRHKVKVRHIGTMANVCVFLGFLTLCLCAYLYVFVSVYLKVVEL